ASRYIAKATQRGDHASRLSLPHGLAELLRGPLLDDPAKARLRAQVVDLLSAELALRRKQLKSDNPDDRAEVLAAMLAWETDAYLASLRDAPMPAEEKKAFAQLWLDAKELLLSAIAGASPERQVGLVIDWLKVRNPGYDGAASHK